MLGVYPAYPNLYSSLRRSVELNAKEQEMKSRVSLFGAVPGRLANTRIALSRMAAEVALPCCARCAAKLADPETNFLTRATCTVLLTGALAIWLGLSLRLAAYRAPQANRC